MLNPTESTIPCLLSQCHFFSCQLNSIAPSLQLCSLHTNSKRSLEQISGILLLLYVHPFSIVSVIVKVVENSHLSQLCCFVFLGYLAHSCLPLTFNF